MDRLYGNSKDLSTRDSIVDPVDFIRVSEDSKENQKPKLFIGRNNTEIWAHQGSNVVFDCLVGRPNLEDQGPVSFYATDFGRFESTMRISFATVHVNFLMLSIATSSFPG